MIIIVGYRKFVAIEFTKKSGVIKNIIASSGRLTLEELEQKMCHNQRWILGLTEQLDTYIEVDLDPEWEIPRKVKGILRKVVLRGEVAFIDWEVPAIPGTD